MQAAGPADSDNVREGPEAVTLHVLCPFGTPPNRFTFNNIPLFTTIAQLRVQLARTILGSTVPTTSRLIFLGRPLTVDSATLGEVLVPSNGSEYTVHFVPQPSAPTRPCVQASSAANPQTLREQNRFSSAIREQNPISSIIAGQNSAIETRVMQLSRDITYDALLGQIRAARRVVWGTSSTNLTETPRPNPVTAEDIARLEIELANFQERANHELRARLESQQAPLRQRPRVHDGPSAGQPLPTASTKRLNTHRPVYQTLGPDGYVAIALPGAASGHQQSHNGPNINLSFGANTAPADRAVAENIVRQALINNQQRRRDENANALGVGRILSRVWLFIRLYFFCYMVSAPDTWTRIFFVTAAALICLLSDTDIPQILDGHIVQPLQRHLEGLAHMGGPGQPIRDDGPRNGLSGEISDYFRRAERSIVLLLASLIPGIGERQVEARNAAEAEAERARQEAHDREQAEEQEQEQEQQARAQAQQTQNEAIQDNENVEEPQQAAAPVPAPVSTDS